MPTPSSSSSLPHLQRRVFTSLSLGDEQLDMTYASTTPPHHVPDHFSDITLYVYLARRQHIPLLRHYVRQRYAPQEYPGSMQRMMAWSPDECIPEFFTDPLVLTSMHADMTDLLLPP